MRTPHFILSLVSLLFVSFSVSAQKKGIETADLKVWGNCGMCKKTIETAAKNAGATEASWSPETKILAVSYNKKNNSSEKIQKAVAASGYDTQDFTAPDEAYGKLHFCCQYDRKETSASATGKKDCCDGKECTHKNESCCKDGKCEKAGHAKHNGKEPVDCCKDNAVCKEKGCCK